jgi:hypothetical protein
MILAIPYTELQTHHMRLYPKTVDRRSRVLYPLGYATDHCQLSDISLVTPPLTFLSYDVATGRLTFDCSKQRGLIGKLLAIQKFIKTTLMPELSREKVEDILQVLYQGKYLTLYTFPSTAVHVGGTLQSVSDLTPGCSVRVALRLYGIISLEYKGIPQLRIQHSVPSLWICN